MVKTALLTMHSVSSGRKWLGFGLTFEPRPWGDVAASRFARAEASRYQSFDQRFPILARPRLRDRSSRISSSRWQYMSRYLLPRGGDFSRLESSRPFITLDQVQYQSCNHHPHRSTSTATPTPRLRSRDSSALASQQSSGIMTPSTSSTAVPVPMHPGPGPSSPPSMPLARSAS